MHDNLNHELKDRMDRIARKCKLDNASCTGKQSIGQMVTLILVKPRCNTQVNNNDND